MPATIAADDAELWPWIERAHDQGGDFLHCVTLAAMYADHENYPILRPVLVELRAKYPAYEPEPG